MCIDGFLKCQLRATWERAAGNLNITVGPLRWLGEGGVRGGECTRVLGKLIASNREGLVASVEGKGRDGSGQPSQAGETLTHVDVIQDIHIY